MNNILEIVIGMSVDAAQDAVRKVGLAPWVSNKDTIRPSHTYPRNVVDLHVNDENVVVDAVTQESIDAKYSCKVYE